MCREGSGRSSRLSMHTCIASRVNSVMMSLAPLSRDSQAKALEWLAMLLQGIFQAKGLKSLMSLTLAGRFLYH